ncbi:MAG TPA: proline--tRNA ligase [Acidimicrobiia bacterium]|nr:proline--tRNA ligase [Acidimicrobiia bacterium]
MRWSRAYIPTLRDDPADAEAVSHRLLVRGGYIRQLMAGSYSLLPLGFKVARKVEQIIREEMDAIGGLEFLAPVVHPGELWKRTGRFAHIEELVKFTDRRQSDLVLALTHEEVFALLAAELSSYKQLPQLWYHFQTKFRDEPRPKSGLLRVREFTMKDSYSLDVDQAGLDVQFDNHYAAYTRIFERLGLTAIPVQASSGVMGGSESVEFMVESSAGEDDIAICDSCGYAANLEKATSALSEIDDEPWEGEAERFATPDIRTIAGLAETFDFARGDRQIKTLVYIAEDEPVLVLLRGDHQLQEQKLVDALGTTRLRPAHGEEIVDLMGASAGSLGAVGVSGLRIVADPALQGRTNMTTGANEDDWHLRGVGVSRDIAVDEWVELRTVEAGEACVACGAPLAIRRVIEIGHIFKLGTTYTEALGAAVLDESGQERVIVMGSYGIGVGRSVAVIIEANHDDKGIVWPVSVAPFEAVVTVVKGDDPTTAAAAERIYEGLLARGVDAIIDDRAERPGVKFADAELVGIPYRITVGPRGLAEGFVEIVRRSDGDVDQVAPEEAADIVAEVVTTARS